MSKKTLTCTTNAYASLHTVKPTITLTIKRPVITCPMTTCKVPPVYFFNQMHRSEDITDHDRHRAGSVTETEKSVFRKTETETDVGVEKTEKNR
jgi:hypothetical protein